MRLLLALLLLAIPAAAQTPAEARKKNRRTEIILSPKLDDLMKVLEGIK